MNASRWRLSTRRKLLLGTVLLVMAAMLVLRLMGVAGFNGTQPREMDWNDDGVASRAEVLQGFTAIVVTETSEGARTCRSYARLRAPSEALRVDCRVEFSPSSP